MASPASAPPKKMPSSSSVVIVVGAMVAIAANAATGTIATTRAVRGDQTDKRSDDSATQTRPDSDSAGKSQGKSRGKQKSKGKGKSKNKGGNKGGSGGGKRLPDPSVAHKIFADVLDRHLKPVDGTGNVKLLNWNAEFLNDTKVRYFHELYTHVATFGDFIGVEEATHDGLREWGGLTGYEALCSEENSRGQAVGALVNTKRLKIRKTAVYNSLKVLGINDLRPGYRVYLTDLVSGLNFSVIVLHLKSMRGGEVSSGKVRQLQCENLVKDIGVGKFGGKPALGNMKVFPFLPEHGSGSRRFGPRHHVLGAAHGVHRQRQRVHRREW